jgi:hypothetical protein
MRDISNVTPVPFADHAPMITRAPICTRKPLMLLRVVFVSDFEKPGLV